jgi:hypothetical protein
MQRAGSLRRGPRAVAADRTGEASGIVPIPRHAIHELCLEFAGYQGDVRSRHALPRSRRCRKGVHRPSARLHGRWRRASVRAGKRSPPCASKPEHCRATRILQLGQADLPNRKGRRDRELQAELGFESGVGFVVRSMAACVSLMLARTFRTRLRRGCVGARGAASRS